MNELSNIVDAVIRWCGTGGILLGALILASLAVQARYMAAIGRTLVRGANAQDSAARNGRKAEADAPPVSVVVPIFGEDADFLTGTLPLMLGQRCGRFEVVAVYVGRDEVFWDDLQRLAAARPMLSPVHINCSEAYPVSNKTALNVGIKSARHEHIIITTADARPAGSDWLAEMARGFTAADIVLGYCGVEQKKGVWNMLARIFRQNEYLLWAASPLCRRRTYGASRHNMGFTKSLYFGVRGFNHLNMNIGEDDLFVQRIASADNVAVVISPAARCTERCWHSRRQLDGQIIRFRLAERLYPRRDRAYIWGMPLSRTLFLASCAGAVFLMPPAYAIAAAMLAAARSAALAACMTAACRLTGEQGMVAAHVLCDLAEPVVGPLLVRSADKKLKRWKN